jgi:4-hydroxy-tetrahydrodipicolinate reductase
MGLAITKLVKKRDDCIIVAGVDKKTGISETFKTFNDITQVNVKADVLIDFSHPTLLSPILDFCTKKTIPAVLCTTGYSSEQEEEILDSSRKTAIFQSENMSLGINLMKIICKQTAKILNKTFDIEIIERHHNKKIDAPSGTALMLANVMSDVEKEEQKYVYNRHNQEKPRTINEIGISCVRGGGIVGDHEVLFAGDNETISFRHVAQSKKIYATGAINAALFLCGKSPRLYNMSDLLK